MRTLSILGLIAVAVLASAPARAVTVVDFSGSTEGCFGTGCTVASSASVGHLSFTGGTFTGIPAAQ
jgi:acyl-CoA reductase-like NAD-dependent aldehyde dehydrogenase